jgi:hypothetical protein
MAMDLAAKRLNEHTGKFMGGDSLLLFDSVEGSLEVLRHLVVKPILHAFISQLFG